MEDLLADHIGARRLWRIITRIEEATQYRRCCTFMVVAREGMLDLVGCAANLRFSNNCPKRRAWSMSRTRKTRSLRVTSKVTRAASPATRHNR